MYASDILPIVEADIFLKLTFWINRKIIAQCMLLQAPKRRMDMALCMGQHKRLGADSPVSLLSKDTLDYIRGLVFLEKK